jgi:hypothetical protein
MPIGAKMYEQSQSDSGDAAPEDSTEAKDEPLEGEVVDGDQEKKED